MKTHRKQYLMPILFAAFAAALLVAQPLFAADPDPRAIMDKVNTNRKLDGSEGLQSLVIISKKGHKRVRKLAMVSKLYDGGKTEKRMARFLSPADVKGTGLLTFDYETKTDDMWLYMPALRKTRRIVSSEKSKSFMGSEFSYSDMTIPTLDDFKYKFLREEQYENATCQVIEVTPINESVADENGFSKRVVWVGKHDFAVRKVHYWDLSGEFFKEMRARDIRLVDKKNNKYRAFHLEADNKLTGRKSEMQMHELKLRTDIPDDYFTTRYLERQ